MIHSPTDCYLHTPRPEENEYSRIISAAVINRRFRQLLLNDPIKAISDGYSGEQFEINSEEKSRLSTIKASSLADFAAQLTLV